MGGRLFQIEAEKMAVDDLTKALKDVNKKVEKEYHECTCELILVPPDKSFKEMILYHDYIKFFKICLKTL